jgi:hypothetical protein
MAEVVDGNTLMPAGGDRMVNYTAAWTTTKIGAVRKPAAVTTWYVRRKLPKISSGELVDVTLLMNPRTGNLVGRQHPSNKVRARPIWFMYCDVQRHRSPGRGAPLRGDPGSGATAC